MSNFTVIYRFQHTTSGLYIEADRTSLKKRFNKLLNSGRITLEDEFVYQHPIHGKMQHAVQQWLREFE